MRRLLTLFLSIMVLASLVRGSHAFVVSRLHPFEECTADQLARRLRTAAHPWSGRIALTALQNDWAHRALALSVSPGEEQATVTLSLQGAPELRRQVRLRVVGFVKQTPYGWVMDPIFDRPAEIDPKWGQWVRNLDNLRPFPTVTATPADPVVLWLTADTRGLAPGSYSGALRLVGSSGAAQHLPVRLTVRPFALPIENPLICQGWQWIPGAPTKLDGARVFHEYGINATHVDGDMAACRAAGYRFFMFVFNPSWRGQDPAEVPAAEVDQRIAEVQAMIRQLRLKPAEWALHTIDEPNDKSVPNQVKWCQLIRQKWPAARFLFNPGWGPGPKNEWSSVAGTVTPLAPFANVWCPYSWWLWDGASGTSLPLMNQAGAVWFYEIMNFPYTRQPSNGRGMLRTLPWVAWKYGLQGACWYSLNAISQNPYLDDPKGAEYAASYYAVPARSLEALREGLQEYKRMQALRALGADERTLKSFTDRALNARHVRDYDALRQEMDALLARLSAKT